MSQITTNAGHVRNSGNYIVIEKTRSGLFVRVTCVRLIPFNYTVTPELEEWLVEQRKKLDNNLRELDMTREQMSNKYIYTPQSREYILAYASESLKKDKDMYKSQLE